MFSDMILAAAMHPETFSSVDDAVARLRRRDPEAITAVVSRYQHRLYRYLLRVVGDPAAAEDLFQQAWLRVIEKIAQYDPRRNFESWLFSVAHNLAIYHLRRRRGFSLDEPDESGHPRAARLAAGGQDPLEQLLEFERGEMLAAAMAVLPPIHREVLSLRFEEEMKLEQIAEVAGIPVATVKSRLYRALEGMREALRTSGREA
jgi:RNA polymerase sigma-70 factor (ECF subfamily)